VELEGILHPDSFQVDGSSIYIQSSEDKPTQGWDFGVSGTSPFPLPNIPSEKPHLRFAYGSNQQRNSPPWIKDTVTGKDVFQLPGKYAKPVVVQCDGHYLVAGYKSGEVLILNFISILSSDM
jgi:hypothetical protein